MEHKDTYNNFKTEKEKYANRSRKRVIDTHTSPWVWLHRGSFCVLKISFSFNFGKKKTKDAFLYFVFAMLFQQEFQLEYQASYFHAFTMCIIFVHDVLPFILLSSEDAVCVRLSVQTTQLFGQANKMGSHRRVQNLHPT